MAPPRLAGGARGREGDEGGGMGVLSISMQGCGIGEAGVSAIASTPRASREVLVKTLNLRGNEAGGVAPMPSPPQSPVRDPLAANPHSVPLRRSMWVLIG